MEFQILGPLEVRHEGTQVALGAAKQRALLAILLVHANELVSSDRLIEELWPQPPETAANTLQVYVGKLRKALEPERTRGAPGELLLTRAPGYMLRVEPDELDADRFERLLSEGRTAREANDHATAARRLHEALELWRGPALADFTYDPFAQAEIARLEELRLDAIEERIEADLALGKAADLVGQLEALISDHPLRERLRGQLMLALYRSGRQADALEVYRQTRETLDEELGLAPSRPLQRLQTAILRQEPALEVSIEAAAAESAEPPEPASPAGRHGRFRGAQDGDRADRAQAECPGPGPRGSQQRGRTLPRRPRADRGALRRNHREQPRQLGDRRLRGPAGPRGRRVPGRVCGARDPGLPRSRKRPTPAQRPASESRPVRSWRAVPAPAWGRSSANP